MKSLEGSVLRLVEELIVFQHQKLYKLGQQVIPNLTTDDLLQPNDFPSLENNPLFRYEEGVLEGLMTAKAALIAHFRDAIAN